MLVCDLSLELAEGRITCLIGASGCGKSSIVKWLCGILPAEMLAEGQARLDGAPLTPPHRAISYQPQQDTLFPWLTIAENAALGLELGGMPRSRARARVLPLLATFGLAGHVHSFPDQLSGGMRQRAAFLRTMVRDSRFLLLDEPFSALDAVTRLRMQNWLCARLADQPRGVLMVTHDLYEATQIADRILVMSGHPARINGDISLITPRAARSESSLAETRARLKSLLLEENP